MKTYVFSPEEISIPPRVLAARMGFRGAGEIPERFEKHFNIACKLAHKVAKPRAVVEEYEASLLEEGVKIDGINVSGKLAMSQLGKAKMVSAMLVTLGRQIDEEVSLLHKNGMELESFFLDAIGSEMVEFTARKVDGILRRRVLKGSARISPGYVDLPLELNRWFAQRMGKIIDVICDDESFTFLPRKTISAFVGWFE